MSPKASRTALTGWRGEVLKLSVTAVAERGRANAAVLQLLAQALGVRRSAIAVVGGPASADTSVEITGLGLTAVRIALDAAMAASRRSPVHR